MFINDLESKDDGRKVIIGKFNRIENDCVILNIGSREIKVVDECLDSYNSKNIMVIGIIDNDKFFAEKVRPVEDDFNFDNYNKLVKLNSKFPEIF